LNQITRAQIVFLLLLYQLDVDIIKLKYVNQYQITNKLALVYINQLITAKYVEKVLRGQYQLTQRALNLITEIEADYQRRRSRPFKWTR